MLEFRSLADMLQPEIPAALEESGERFFAADEAAVGQVEDQDRLREVRLFNAHVRETVHRSVESLLAGIAREILARELLLAPADIRALVDATLERFPHSQTLRVRVHRDDVWAFANYAVPVQADDDLQRGDAFVDVRNGSIDVTLQVRTGDLIARQGRA